MLPVLANPSFIEGFSISGATILNRYTGLPEPRGTMYAVTSGAITADVTSWDDVSNDTVVNTWNDVNFLDVKLEFGFLALEAFSTMHETELVRTGTGLTQTIETELYPRAWGKTLPYPVKLDIPSKDQYGNLRTLEYILYKVKFLEFDFMSASYKEGMPITYTGKALLSATDETGSSLLEPSFGRLISTAV